MYPLLSVDECCDCPPRKDVKEKTASLYTALLNVGRVRLDHPGQDKSRALRPHSESGDTMQR